MLLLGMMQQMLLLAAAAAAGVVVVSTVLLMNASAMRASTSFIAAIVVPIFGRSVSLLFIVTEKTSRKNYVENGKYLILIQIRKN